MPRTPGTSVPGLLNKCARDNSKAAGSGHRVQQPRGPAGPALRARRESCASPPPWAGTPATLAPRFLPAPPRRVRRFPARGAVLTRQPRTGQQRAHPAAQAAAEREGSAGRAREMKPRALPRASGPASGEAARAHAPPRGRRPPRDSPALQTPRQWATTAGLALSQGRRSFHPGKGPQRSRP